MKKFEGVIFDMDGLLFDTELVYYEATQKIADEMKIPYTKERYMEFIGVSDEEVKNHYHQIYHEYGKETVNEFIRRAYEETYRVFASETVPLKDGVLELLDYLEHEEIPFVIASSNVRTAIELLLTKVDILDRFSGIISSEDVIRAKPDPEIFNKAVTFLNTPPEKTLILEDSKHGILAAKSAGIPVIMIPDLIEPTPDLQVHTLEIFDSLKEVPIYLSK